MPTDDRERDHRDADQQRQPRAMDQARKHVAADGVGAERIGATSRPLPERRLQEGGVVGEVGRMGRDHVGEDRHEHHGDDDDEAGDRAVIGAEIAPELAQRMRRRGGGAAAELS